MFTFLNSISSNITEAKLQRLAVWWWGNWTGRWGRELQHIVGWSGKENIRGRESKLAAKRIRVVKSGVYVLILSPVYVCMFSPVQLFATLWTTARQAPLSMKCSRQEYRRSSRPRDQTQISCVPFMGRWIPSHYTTWETLSPHIRNYRQFTENICYIPKELAFFSLPSFLSTCLVSSSSFFFFPLFFSPQTATFQEGMNY